MSNNNNNKKPLGALVPSLPLTQTNPLYQAAYVALERKKFLQLAKKKQHLCAIQTIKERDVEALFPGDEAKGLREEMRVLHTDIVPVGLGKNKREKAWRSHYASSILASIYVAMEMRKGMEFPTPSAQRASRSRSSNATALPLFRSAAKDVKQAVDKQEDEDIEKLNKKSSIKQQKYGNRKQDKIPFDPTKLEKAPCPQCGCMACMAITPIDEVNQKNKENWEKYMEEVEEYQRNGGKKPRFPPSEGQWIGCWGYKLHCKYQADGGNCPECQKATGTSKYLTRDADGKPACLCPICNSKCDAMFLRGNRHKAAVEVREQKEAVAAPATANVSSLPQLFTKYVGNSLQNGVIDAAAQANTAVDDPVAAQNSFAFAAHRLLTNPEVQGNMAMRHAMQGMGPMGTETRDGLSIDALRKGRTVGDSGVERARGFGVPNPRELQQQQHQQAQPPQQQPRQQQPRQQPQPPHRAPLPAGGPPTFNHQDQRHFRNKLSPVPDRTDDTRSPLEVELAAAAGSGSGSTARPRPTVTAAAMPPPVAAAMPPPAQVSAVSKRSYSTRGSSSLNPISILESDSESSGFSLYSTSKTQPDIKPVVVKSEFKLPPLPKRRKASVPPATPAFARKIRQESLKQSFGNNTPSTMEVLDQLSFRLTAEDTSAEAMALKKRAQDMENLCPNVEQATGSLVKFAKRQLFAKQGKQACPAPSNTGGLNLLAVAASTGSKRPAAAGRGLGLGLGLKRVGKKRVVKRSALSKPVVAAAKKASAVASKKASPGGLPSSQSSGGFDYGDSD